MLAYGTVLLHLVRREDVSECMNIFINVTYLYTPAYVLSVLWLARATTFRARLHVRRDRRSSPGRRQSARRSCMYARARGREGRSSAAGCGRHQRR